MIYSCEWIQILEGIYNGITLKLLTYEKIYLIDLTFVTFKNKNHSIQGV